MKICIDAGHNHSGWDTGAAGNGLREQDITWLIADKLRQLLKAAGVAVVMTRTSNEHNLGSNLSTSLRKRADTCNANKCDYFISIHCNAGGGTGTEVLVIKKGGQAETLAEKVLRYISELTGKSRGVKEQNAYVLKHTDCPAILVETAFIDTEADSLVLRFHHDEIAEAIFKGICEHCGIEPNKELESVNDIVWELSNRGVVTDTEGMLAEINQNPNGRLYWLAKKFANYTRRN
jgi:N-acetylmuramoyl-L-alanine amidase